MKADDRQKVPVHMGNCIYCGSANIVRNIKIGQTADAGRIGLAYRTRFVVTGMEAVLADLCDDCGSLLRIFVDAPGRKWVTK